MKYGKVDDPERYDLKLPDDHPECTFGKDTDGKEAIYFGGTMWNIPAWKGKIYPEKCKQADFIGAYGKQFGTIELNATHYRTPAVSTVQKWHTEVAGDFKFCPKWPQGISHYRRFRNCDELTEAMLVACSAFQEKLGPSFIQLPPNYTSNHGEQLMSYLEELPEDLNMSVEFRHPSWFDGNADAERVWELMSAKAVNAVISDTAGRRDAVHMRMTSSKLILRFGGYDLHKTDHERWTEWSQRLKSWFEKGLKEVYVLMHQSDSIMTPESCLEFNDLIKKETGVEGKVPQLRPTLF